jgi:hypothetical protein
MVAKGGSPPKAILSHTINRTNFIEWEKWPPKLKTHKFQDELEALRRQLAENQREMERLERNWTQREEALKKARK